jgi:transcriptional regulator with XRE-family HTH domain
MKIYAAKLKSLRQKQSWTQEDLAERANVHPRTVQRAEATSFASRRTIKSFADALGIEVGDLTVSVQIPFAAVGILNAIIWAMVMILIGITFRDQPESNASIQRILSFAAPSSMILIWWLSGRYRRQSSTM